MSATRRTATASLEPLLNWSPITSKVGNELACTYRLHLLDVLEFDGAWQWSAAHRPRLCRPAGRGAYGTAPTRTAAMLAALAAVDAFGCAPSIGGAA